MICEICIRTMWLQLIDTACLRPKIKLRHRKLRRIAVKGGTTMSRSSKHQKCIKCGRSPQLGVSITYYSLRPKHSAMPRHEQAKGALPSRGYCLSCFVRFAEQQGFEVNRSEL